MNETKDVKYFGARIGERCRYDDKEGIIEEVYLCCQTSEYLFGVKIRPNTNGTRIISFDGEGITFQPPRKKIKKEVDCFVKHGYSPHDKDRYLFFYDTDGVPEDAIPAKLIYEAEE